jgi:hypothetical protein
LLVGALAVRGVVRWRLRTVLLGVAALPAMLVIMVAAFVISTQNRSERAGAATLDTGQALNVAREASDRLVDSPLIDVVLPPIAARTGYFDFPAELIAHRDRYTDAIGPAAYLRSITDNILTPGFDLFDQPKLANALRFAYLEQGRPSKRQITEEYHSDQLGMYGEAYVLFGLAAPLFLGLFACGLKAVYVRLRAPNPFLLGAKRAILLLVFIRWIDSFGFDWMLSELITFVGAYLLFSYIFTVRRSRAVVAPPAQPLAG